MNKLCINHDNWIFSAGDGDFLWGLAIREDRIFKITGKLSVILKKVISDEFISEKEDEIVNPFPFIQNSNVAACISIESLDSHSDIAEVEELISAYAATGFNSEIDNFPRPGKYSWQAT
jgi:hypothetical protein